METKLKNRKMVTQSEKPAELKEIKSDKPKIIRVTADLSLEIYEILERLAKFLLCTSKVEVFRRVLTLAYIIETEKRKGWTKVFLENEEGEKRQILTDYVMGTPGISPPDRRSH